MTTAAIIRQAEANSCHSSHMQFMTITMRFRNGKKSSLNIPVDETLGGLIDRVANAIQTKHYVRLSWDGRFLFVGPSRHDPMHKTSHMDNQYQISWENFYGSKIEVTTRAPKRILQRLGVLETEKCVRVSEKSLTTKVKDVCDLKHNKTFDVQLFVPLGRPAIGSKASRATSPPSQSSLCSGRP